jgi:hypothetical protein
MSIVLPAFFTYWRLFGRCRPEARELHHPTSIGKNVVLWTTSPMLVQGPQGPWEPQVRGILDDFYPHHGNTSAFQVSPDCQVTRHANDHPGSSSTGHTERHVQVAGHSHVLIDIRDDKRLYFKLISTSYKTYSSSTTRARKHDNNFQYPRLTVKVS